LPIAVSQAQHKEPDLEKQRHVLEAFCTARGVANVAFIEDVGGGLNLRRPKFVTINVEARELPHLIVARKDRLVRFDLQWCERLSTKQGTEPDG
jgi:predicted site-specific integrase-resolvase